MFLGAWTEEDGLKTGLGFWRCHWGAYVSWLRLGGEIFIEESCNLLRGIVVPSFEGDSSPFIENPNSLKCMSSNV